MRAVTFFMPPVTMESAVLLASSCSRSELRPEIDPLLNPWPLTVCASACFGTESIIPYVTLSSLCPVSFSLPTIHWPAIHNTNYPYAITDPYSQQTSEVAFPQALGQTGRIHCNCCERHQNSRFLKIKIELSFISGVTTYMCICKLGPPGHLKLPWVQSTGVWSSAMLTYASTTSTTHKFHGLLHYLTTLDCTTWSVSLYIPVVISWTSLSHA